MITKTRKLSQFEIWLPISHNGKTGCTDIPLNWPGAFQNASDVRKYFDKELANDAVLGPFQFNPFAYKAYLSPLNTWDKKDSEEKRIIVDISFPKGDSINDGIKKDYYLDKQICLKYPTVDKLMEIVKKGKDVCYLTEIFVNFIGKFQFAQNTTINWGVIFEGRWYFDRVLVMGCRSSCYIAQRITNTSLFSKV